MASMSSLFPKIELPNTSHIVFLRRYGFGRAQPIARSFSLFGTLRLITQDMWCRNIMPAIHHLRLSGLSLGPTNPGRINLPREPLGLRRTGFPPVLTLSFRHKLFLALHGSLSVPLHGSKNAPLPLQLPRRELKPATSVQCLSPSHDTSSAQDDSISELLRFL